MRAAKRLVRLGAWTAVLVALAAAATVVALWVTLPDPAALARENPRTTALIEQRRAEAARVRRRPFRVRQTWVGPERFPPVLVQAVLASEDANFFGHEGIDWLAIRDAAEHDLKVGRFARGASTLTQQLAKNLWLGTEKSLSRKAREAVLAAKLERALSKRRILTLYLNVVEVDDGVFGMEAGARHRFGTGVAALSPAQAVVLASILPAPRRVDLARPSTWLKTRSRRLLDRMRRQGSLPADVYARASDELERILAGPAPLDDRAEPPEEEPPPKVAAAPAATPLAPAPPPSAEAPGAPVAGGGDVPASSAGDGVAKAGGDASAAPPQREAPPEGPPPE